MANMNIGTPRFYTDEINYLMSRGVAATEFAVTDTDAGNTFIGGSLMTTGSAAELFDLNPLNKVTFDTSADTDGHVLIKIDTQSATKVNYIAILNHNLVTAVGKIRIFAGDAAQPQLQMIKALSSNRQPMDQRLSALQNKRIDIGQFNLKGIQQIRELQQTELGVQLMFLLAV